MISSASSQQRAEAKRQRRAPSKVIGRRRRATASTALRPRGGSDGYGVGTKGSVDTDTDHRGAVSEQGTSADSMALDLS